MDLAVIGGGSPNVAILLRWLADNPGYLPVRRVTLVDNDLARLQAVEGYAHRLAARAGFDVRATSSLDEALLGAHFVLNHIRVGGTAARRADEELAAQLQLFASDPLGICAFSAALRNVLPCIAIAQRCAELAPEAWILNWTNPAGAVTEAMVRHTHARVVGITSAGVLEQRLIGAAFAVEPQRIEVTIVGTSHLGWVTEARLDGQPVDAKLVSAKVADWLDSHHGSQTSGAVPSALLRLWGYPLPLSNYFGAHLAGEPRREGTPSGVLRADEVLRVEAEALREMRDASGTDLPEVLARRGSPLERLGLYGPAGYFTGGLLFMHHVWFNQPARLAPTLPQHGAVAGLDPQACLTATCEVDGSGPRPLSPIDVPLEAAGLIYSVKAFETLTVRAAVEASKEFALKALSSNPLIGSYPKSERALALILERQAQFLPLWR